MRSREIIIEYLINRHLDNHNREQLEWNLFHKMNAEEAAKLADEVLTKVLLGEELSNSDKFILGIPRYQIHMHHYNKADLVEIHGSTLQFKRTDNDPSLKVS